MQPPVNMYPQPPPIPPEELRNFIRTGIVNGTIKGGVGGGELLPPPPVMRPSFTRRGRGGGRGGAARRADGGGIMGLYSNY